MLYICPVPLTFSKLQIMKNIILSQTVDLYDCNQFITESSSKSLSLSKILEQVFNHVNNDDKFTDYEQQLILEVVNILRTQEALNRKISRHGKEMCKPQSSFILVIILSILIGGGVGGFIGGHFLYAIIGSVVLFILIFFIKNKVASSKNLDDEESVKMEDVRKFLNMTCCSIDKIADAHQQEINTTILQMSQQKDIPLEQKYEWLVSHIQSLIGYERYKDGDIHYKEELKERCEDLAQIMSNAHLAFIDYNGDNNELFELVETSNISAPICVLPSVLKNEEMILKGKVFIPSNS